MHRKKGQPKIWLQKINVYQPSMVHLFYMVSHIFTFNCTTRLILLQVAVQSIYNLKEVAGLHSLGMSPVMECGNRAITHSTSKFGMTSATSFCSHLNIAYSIVGASLSEPRTNMTSLHTCVCMFACLDRPLTVNFKWGRILILRKSSSWYCQSAVSVTWSWDDWSWSTHGILLLIYYRSSTAGCPQAVQILITAVWAIASGR